MGSRVAAQGIGSERNGPAAEFLDAALAPLDGGHTSGTLERANEILAAHPEVATASIHAAAVLGDDATVRGFLAADAAAATAKGGPRGWDPLTHLCFSRYLRLDRARSDGFVRAAEALLDAGADPNTGWFGDEHLPNPVWESAIYGAAGVAHHAGLTRLLLERGADPNDDETPYHAPEWFDHPTAQVLVESGKLTADSLDTMLLRKLDWTDYDDVRFLLEHGADPNLVGRWGKNALHHAVGRDSALRFFELLLDHGADPGVTARDGSSAFQRAAAAGRGDVLELFERRGFAARLEGDDAFLAACARGEEAAAREMASRDPGLVARLSATRLETVALFAGAGNVEGLRILLDLGFPLASRSDLPQARGEPALHLAVWRERLAAVKLLLARGAPLEERNRAGLTPLQVAVRALTEQTEWTPHASTDVMAALLEAGARADAVQPFPTGTPAADELLRRYLR